VAHDFLFNRRSRWAAIAAYTIIGVLPPEVDRKGQVSWAELEAPSPQPVAEQLYPDTAPGKRRAGNTGYWIPPNLLPLEDRKGQVSWTELEVPSAEVPASRGFVSQPLPNHAKAQRKGQAYYRFVSINVGGADIPIPRGVQLLPERAPGKARASNDAYETHSVPLAALDVTTRKGQVSWAEFETPSAIPRGNALIPDRAPPARRSSNTSYWIEQPHIALQDRKGQTSWAEFEAPFADPRGQSLLPDRAPGARRAGKTAYETGTQPPAEVTTRKGQVSWAEFEAPFAPLPTGAIIYPDKAPGARRTANSAYFVTNPVPLVATRKGQVSWAEFEVPAVDLPPSPGFIAQPLSNHAKALQKGRAYYRFAAIKAGGPDVTSNRKGQVSWAEFEVPAREPPGAQLLPDRAPGHRRTSNDAYGGTNVPQIITTQREGRVSWAEFEIPSNPPPEGTTLLANRVRPKFNSALYRFSSGKTGDVFEPPEGFIIFPQKAEVIVWRNARRAANTAYFVNAFTPPVDDRKGQVSWTELEVPSAIPRGQSLLPDKAPGARRASNTAYETGTQLPAEVTGRRGRVSWAEFEVPPVDLPPNPGFIAQPLLQHTKALQKGRAYYRFVAIKAGGADFTNRKGQVSWAEFEVPSAEPISKGFVSQPHRISNRASNTAYEIGQLPLIDDRRGQVSWTEFEIPFAQPIGVSLLPSRAPGARRAANRAYWAEQNPSEALLDRRGQVSWTEFEVPFAQPVGTLLLPDKAPGKARAANEAYQVYQALTTVLQVGRRGQVSWAEFQVPGGVGGRITNVLLIDDITTVD